MRISLELKYTIDNKESKWLGASMKIESLAHLANQSRLELIEEFYDRLSSLLKDEFIRAVLNEE